MTIEEQQELIISLIQDELLKPKELGAPLKSLIAVWFEPSMGRFLYQDVWVRYEAISQLIDRKILEFKGIEFYQGTEMLMYSLP